MTQDRMHITATETRHLCGSLAGGPRSRSLPWAFWIELYEAQPSGCCAMCRLTARRSADRSREIDRINATRKDPPEY